MIDFILDDKGDPVKLACNCDRAAIKQNLAKYITSRTQVKSWGTVREDGIVGLCCGYCKSVILPWEIEKRLEEIDKAKDNA